ncbi:MAG: hypothetical protein B7Y16_07010 [Methylotenera sp. 24-45-7]|jgi:hypothetical protein|nr:MAG: hypothetical protein B7Y16_07010 [Methylotenera sp. 24-45-7]HQS43954.1 hypothetical protein [Methylotenera sp.]
MKKMPAPIKEPALNGLTNPYKNHTPKLHKKPLSKFATYQNLIDEFMDANPNHTDAELDHACLNFATQCGLTVAAKAKEKMRGNHV